MYFRKYLSRQYTDCTEKKCRNNEDEKNIQLGKMEKVVKRNSEIDVLKGLGMLLVIIGHTTNDKTLFSFIYSFHMPLFFFISGILFNPTKYDTLKTLLVSKVKTLLIPYVFFFFITYFYWLIIEKNLRSIDVSWYKPLIGLFYGVEDGTGYLINNTVLWFLPALFTTEILFYSIFKFISKKYIF